MASGEYERRLASIVLVFLGFILILGTADLVDDFHKGASTWHLVTDSLALSLMVVGIVAMALRMYGYGQREREMASQLEASLRDAEHWHQEASARVEGLSEAIDRQFERWGLSAAEKEVALRLLEGKGYRDIAATRDVKERTIRTQAQAIYAKANVGGRAELAAFFLHRLLSLVESPRE
ncbi:MAG: LuxR C-terminal-related transcriptional regulator [Candidatus Binatia bacterium]